MFAISMKTAISIKKYILYIFKFTQTAEFEFYRKQDKS